MGTLVYYIRERQTFQEEFSLNLTDTQAVFIYLQLKKRFGLKQPLRFKGFHQGGSANRQRIQVSHKPSIALLSHEVAHLIQFRKRDKHVSVGIPKKKNFHTKEHKKLMKKVIEYINSHLPEWLDEVAVKNINTEGNVMNKYTVVRKIGCLETHNIEATNWKEAQSKVESIKPDLSRARIVISKVIQVKRIRDAKPEKKPTAVPAKVHPDTAKEIAAKQ